MHLLCESLPALGLRGHGLGQSSAGTWINIAPAPTRAESGAVTWPGDLDLAPDAMHDEIKAHGEWVLR